MCLLQLEAKAKEIDSEKHLKALADREMGRLNKDIGKLSGERQELRDKVCRMPAYFASCSTPPPCGGKVQLSV